MKSKRFLRTAYKVQQMFISPQAAKTTCSTIRQEVITILQALFNAKDYNSWPTNRYLTKLGYAVEEESIMAVVLYEQDPVKNRAQPFTLDVGNMLKTIASLRATLHDLVYAECAGICVITVMLHYGFPVMIWLPLAQPPTLPENWYEFEMNWTLEMAIANMLIGTAKKRKDSAGPLRTRNIELD